MAKNGTGVRSKDGMSKGATLLNRITGYLGVCESNRCKKRAIGTVYILFIRIGGRGGKREESRKECQEVTA